MNSTALRLIAPLSLLVLASCDTAPPAGPDSLVSSAAPIEAQDPSPGAPATIADLLPGEVAGLALDFTTLPAELDSLDWQPAVAIRPRVVDGAGRELRAGLPLRLVLVAGPDSAWLQQGDGPRVYQGDTLRTMTGLAERVLRVQAAGRPGTVQLEAWIPGERAPLAEHNALATLPVGLAVRGEIAVDAVGEALGEGLWQIWVEARFWTRRELLVADERPVRLRATPPERVVLDTLAYTSFEEHPGLARAALIYPGSAIGDSLDGLWAWVEGLVPDASHPSGWRPGPLRLSIADPDDPDERFALPYQPGEGLNNLTLTHPAHELVFPMDCGGGVLTQELPVTATLVDGYGNPARGQGILFWSGLCGSFAPSTGLTDEDGRFTSVLTCTSNCLTLAGPCPEPDTDCQARQPYTLAFGAVRLPAGEPQSATGLLHLRQPCETHR
jgi:hypothetical protein